MYLSRLVLNVRDGAARRDLANPYDMHRTLYRAFPGALEPGEERLLWRLEHRRPNPPFVLVQTWAPPSWQDLPSGYLHSPSESKEFEVDLPVGTVLVFRLRANPCVTREGKRLGLVGDADQVGWLRRQGERGGFEVVDAGVIESGHLKARSGGHSIDLLAATFEGALRVAEKERFELTLRKGLGHGKAMGLGLMSVARS